MTLRPVRRAVRRVLAATARHLSPARGEALRAGAHAAVTLVTGRPSGVGRRKQAATAARAARAASAQASARAAMLAGGPAAAQREAIERAEVALARGDAAAAARISSRLVRELPANLRVRQLHAAALADAGDSAEHALALHRAHTLKDDATIRHRERVVAGRLAVLSPGWQPALAQPQGSAMAASPADDVVLVLAAASGPYVATPVTERLAILLPDLVAAGFRPQVVTALGFPRSVRATDIPRVTVYDGIPHHRLDLGPYYDLDGPPDRRLQDAAWLAAAIGANIRPALVHAVISARDIDMGLVGIALRRRLGVPLVIEVAGPTEPALTPDDARMEAATRQLLEVADGIVAGGGGPNDRALRTTYADAATRHAAASR